MHKLACLFLLLAALPASPQTTQPKIKGIKVLSTAFDPLSEKKQITFMNDTPFDITAYEIEAVTTYAHGYVGKLHSSQDLLAPGWRTIDLRHRPFLQEIPLGGDVIHPGQSVTKEWGNRYDAGPAASAVIRLDVVVYANGTAETTDPARLDGILQNRQLNGKLHHRAAAMAREILADANTDDSNALMYMRDKLSAERGGFIEQGFFGEIAKNFADALTPGTFKGSPIEAIVWDHNKKRDGAGQVQILREFAEEEEQRAREFDAGANVKAVNQ